MGSFQLDTKTIADNIAGTVGRVTAAVGTVLGGLTSLLMIIVLGIFIAIEPRLYERGVAWMLPMKSRENFYRSEEHTSELQSLMRISYAVFCLKKKKKQRQRQTS